MIDKDGKIRFAIQLPAICPATARVARTLPHVSQPEARATTGLRIQTILTIQYL